MQEDIRRMFGTCLLVSIAEFALIHVSNLYPFTPLLLVPIVVSWQMAMPLSFFNDTKGFKALRQSMIRLWKGSMLVSVGIAVTLVRSLIC